MVEIMQRSVFVRNKITCRNSHTWISFAEHQDRNDNHKYSRAETKTSVYQQNMFSILPIHQSPSFLIVSLFSYNLFYCIETYLQLKLDYSFIDINT